MSLLEAFGFATAHPDALSLIRKDHDTFRSLLKRLNATTVRGQATRTRLFAQLRDLLKAHEAMEEQVIYRALKKIPAATDIIMEGLQEHHATDLLRQELATLPVTSPAWGPKLHVLGEGLEHHLKEEEHTMFVKARLLLPEPKLVALGTRMQAIRRRLLTAAAARPERAGKAPSPPAASMRATARPRPRRRSAKAKA